MPALHDQLLGAMAVTFGQPHQGILTMSEPTTPTASSRDERERLIDAYYKIRQSCAEHIREDVPKFADFVLAQHSIIAEQRARLSELHEALGYALIALTTDNIADAHRKIAADIVRAALAQPVPPVDEAGKGEMP